MENTNTLPIVFDIDGLIYEVHPIDCFIKPWYKLVLQGSVLSIAEFNEDGASYDDGGRPEQGREIRSEIEAARKAICGIRLLHPARARLGA